MYTHSSFSLHFQFPERVQQTKSLLILGNFVPCRDSIIKNFKVTATECLMLGYTQSDPFQHIILG